ncbi:unnamed protein product [Withania somnifera]
MASINDQAKFLALGSSRIYINNDDNDITMELYKEKRRRRRCIKCCGCCIATTLVIIVIMLVLGFTIFRVHEPSIRMNSVKFDGINYLLTSNSTTLQSNVNFTVLGDVSIKNPNAASFKFNEGMTSLFYDDVVIGDALMPLETAKARRTLRMNLTMDIMVVKILSIPRLGRDLSSGELPMSTYTRINGRVNILNIIKKNAGIRMSCIMMVDLRNQYVRDIDCRRKVWL